MNIKDYFIKVMENDGSTEESLRLAFNLVKDDLAFSIKLILNDNLPEDIVFEMAKDKNENVRCLTIFHKNTSFRVLKLMLNDTADKVKAVLATSEILDKASLKHLSKSTSYLVRARVAKNKKTPSSVLKKLAKDKNHYVSEIAKDELKLRQHLISDYIDI